MNKKIKAQWLKALRSGRYKQTTGTLCDGQAYCCLGVLGRVTGASKKWLVDPDNTRQTKLPGETDFKPSKRLPDYGARSILAGKNDAGIPFKQIADYIEKYL